VIYDLRLSILEAQDLEATAREMIVEAAGKVLANNVDDDEEGADAESLRSLKDELLRTFLLLIEDLETHEGLSSPALRELIVGRLETAFTQRLELWGTERAPILLQRIMLGVIDEKWKEHLFELDHVKAGINYRAWGQKDPLIEYKKEAFEMFVEMLDDVHVTVASLLFKAQIVEAPPNAPPGGRGARRSPAQQIALQHGVASPFAAPGRQTLSGPDEREAALGAAAAARGDSASPFGGAPAPGPRRPVSVDKAPGRNEPCPCGSGKKYKVCHGR
jgi:preprotein translocase subunit SecA